MAKHEYAFEDGFADPSELLEGKGPLIKTEKQVNIVWNVSS